jgi:bis(5'-nucleosidyl)-tetraphosphatase
MSIIKDESFGVIPLQLRDGVWYVFLILHAKGNHWSFPKGHADPHETPLQAATRELKEETGLDLKELLQEEPLIESYQFYRKNESVIKTVYYFPAIVSGEIALQGEEIRDGRWLPLNEASQRLSFKEARSLCDQVMQKINEKF